MVDELGGAPPAELPVQVPAAPMFLGVPPLLPHQHYCAPGPLAGRPPAMWALTCAGHQRAPRGLHGVTWETHRKLSHSGPSSPRLSLTPISVPLSLSSDPPDKHLEALVPYFHPQSYFPQSPPLRAADTEKQASVPSWLLGSPLPVLGWAAPPAPVLRALPGLACQHLLSLRPTYRLPP